jgi:lon-related putative ATP-dependent protease
MEPPRPELAAESLRRRCAPESLGISTTDELAPLEQVLGQARAMEAIELGVGLARPGFNLFVLGPAGTGRHEVVRERLGRAAAAAPTPDDWAYVHNFGAEHRPRALRMPPGRGARLRADMAALVEELQTALPTAFESEDHQTRRQVIDEEFKEREAKAFSELGAKAREQGLAMLRTPLGVAFAPARGDDVLTPDQYEALGDEERARLEKAVGELRQALEKQLRQAPRWQRERRGRLRELQHDVARQAVHSLIDELRDRYRELPEVVAYLDEVEEDVVRRAPAFVVSDAIGGGDESAPGAAAAPLSFRRYQVNLIVDREGTEGAPLVDEDHPTYVNLCGRVEHLSQMGALVTDFTLIKAGAMHRANGGYLILDALELLRQPFAWDALKRALRTGQLRLESLGQSLSLVSTVSLEPEPIPLDVKVALVGERILYYLLAAYDPDFPRLFKLAADFDDRLEWTPENQALYARLVAALARRGGLAPFDRGAVARIVEQAAREAGDAERLSLATGRLADLLAEADHRRRAGGHEVTRAADVEQAIAARERRADRLRERWREETLRGTLRIATAGREVGQVNGLSVVELGDFAFGHPTRITARVRLGGGEVVDILREVELAGPIHSKGVLTLAGFLGERYASEVPLSLAASLVFEQSYGEVEGDSASLAELCALLSAIGLVPLAQAVAVTGAVDQRGEVQAVGGVNEKIEGFFDLCAARGLDSSHGVVLPVANVRHLMLRGDVVDAVAADRFHVWPVTHVDEAIERLAGMPAGARGDDGLYPPDSVNAAVETRLALFAEIRRSFAAAGKEDEGDGGSAP